MAKEKKVEQITDMEADFAQWFTDVCVKAELVDYSGVKGLFILRPYGYAIWENIMGYLDRRFKELGHENVSMPLLIPESLLQKEKDHVEGFAPECAWVTHGGEEKLPEKLCIRPTSETLFRGVAFGSLRPRSRVLAYAVSMVLFSVYHIWQYAFLGVDARFLLYLLQYVPMSVALGWCYARSGSIWVCIFAHMGYNALAFSIL